MVRILLEMYLKSCRRDLVIGSQHRAWPTMRRQYCELTYGRSYSHTSNNCTLFFASFTIGVSHEHTHLLKVHPFFSSISRWTDLGKIPMAESRLVFTDFNIADVRR